MQPSADTLILLLYTPRHPVLLFVCVNKRIVLRIQIRVLSPVMDYKSRVEHLFSFFSLNN